MGFKKKNYIENKSLCNSFFNSYYYQLKNTHLIILYIQFQNQFLVMSYLYFLILHSLQLFYLLFWQFHMLDSYMITFPLFFNEYKTLWYISYVSLSWGVIFIKWLTTSDWVINSSKHHQRFHLELFNSSCCFNNNFQYLFNLL